MPELDTDIRDDLHRLAAGAPDVVVAPPAVLDRVRRRRRTKAACATAALFLVVGGGGAATVVVSESDGSSGDRTVEVAAPDAAPLQLGDPGELELTVDELPASPLAARQDHEGVWTGDELIIWGGGQAGRVFDDGAAYDPTTGAWRSLPPAPVPGRARHTAVWTGTEMIVWGGTASADGSGGLLDGAAYDPATNRWRTISPAPRGTDRTYGSAVFTEGLVVIAGGHGPTRHGLTTALVYDVGADRWVEEPLGRPTYALTTVEDQVVVAQADDETKRVTFAVFDPRSGTLSRLADFPLEAPVDWVGLTSEGSHLIAAATSTEETTVAVLPVPTGTWQAETTVDSGDYTPGVGVSFPFSPGLDAWNGRWLLSWSPSSLYAMAPGTTRTVELSEALCNANGTAVWTGTSILQWGGQDCWNHSTENESATGVIVTLTR